MSNQKFFKCNKCGNFVGLINNAGVPMNCCGEPMEELIPKTKEAGTEKHLPVVEVKERLVYAKVGSELHAMTEEHHIEFIYIETYNGGQRRSLKVGDKPEAMFCLMKDKPVAVFEYCNLHGLWKTDIMCDCGCGETMKDCKCNHSCDHHGNERENYVKR